MSQLQCGHYGPFLCIQMVPIQAATEAFSPWFAEVALLVNADDWCCAYLLSLAREYTVLVQRRHERRQIPV